MYRGPILDSGLSLLQRWRDSFQQPSEQLYKKFSDVLTSFAPFDGLQGEEFSEKLSIKCHELLLLISQGWKPKNDLSRNEISAFLEELSKVLPITKSQKSLGYLTRTSSENSRRRMVAHL